MFNLKLAMRFPDYNSNDNNKYVCSLVVANPHFTPKFYCSHTKMCGGWACASYELACNNPPLSTLRYSGRDFIPTPCGPHDKCFVKDTSCSRGHCLVPLQTTIKMNPCLEFSAPIPPVETGPRKVAVDNWRKAYDKLAKCCNQK